MNLLFLADQESRSLWDFYEKEKLQNVDLILSCGDLESAYLEFLVTLADCPLLYVCGNHDRHYLKHPPEGCICIEDKIYNYKGLRILGLGGSMRYSEDAPFQFTEKEMAGRIRHLKPELTLKNGFDILLTHAPAFGCGDLMDLPHRGFKCFNTLLEQYHPAYMVHGHVHQNYSHCFCREYAHPSGTRILNAYESCRLNIREAEYPAQGHTGSFLYDLAMRMNRKNI